MLKRLVVFAVGAVAILLPATSAGAQTAGAPTVDPSQPACGSAISVDTVLTHDLHCDLGFPFIRIDDGVTLDLNGHRISGNASGSMPTNLIVGNIRNGTMKDVGLDEINGTIDGVTIKGGAVRVNRNATLSNTTRSGAATAFRSATSTAAS
jgi:hypothetical protein